MCYKKAEPRKWFKPVTNKKKFHNVLKNCLNSNFKPITILNNILTLFCPRLKAD